LINARVKLHKINIIFFLMKTTHIDKKLC